MATLVEPSPDLYEIDAIGKPSILDFPYRAASNVLRWIPPQHWPAILTFAPLASGKSVDLTSYIQAAIDDLELKAWADATLPGSDTLFRSTRVQTPALYFPPGLYHVSGLETEGTITLVGDGPNSSFLAWTGQVRLGKSPGATESAGDVTSVLVDVVAGGSRASVPIALQPVRERLRKSLLGQGTVRLGGIRRMALVGTPFGGTLLEALVRVRPAVRARFDIEWATLSGSVEAGIVASAFVDRLALSDVQFANLGSDGVRLLADVLDPASALGPAGPMTVVSLRRLRVAGTGKEAYDTVRSAYVSWVSKRDPAAGTFMSKPANASTWCLGGPVVAIPATSRRVVVRWSHGVVRRRMTLPVGSGALIACAPTSRGEVVVALSDITGEVHPDGHGTVVERGGDRVSVRARNVAFAGARHLVRPSLARIGSSVVARLDEIVPASATGLVLYGPRFSGGIVDNGGALTMEALKTDGSPVTPGSGRRRGGDVVVNASPMATAPAAARVHAVDEGTWLPIPAWTGTVAVPPGALPLDTARIDGFLGPARSPVAIAVDPLVNIPPAFKASGLFGTTVLSRIPMTLISPGVDLRAGDVVVFTSAGQPTLSYVCTIGEIDLVTMRLVLTPSSKMLVTSSVAGTQGQLIQVTVPFGTVT